MSMGTVPKGLNYFRFIWIILGVYTMHTEPRILF